MARIRTVKPSFFRHHELYKAEQETGLPLRLAFAGLWTAADREGRFKWQPEELKLDCLPYDDVDFSRVLDALATRGFLVRYREARVNEPQDFGFIPSWRRHQVVNVRERASELPSPEECEIIQQDADASTTREPRVSDTHMRARGEQEKEQEQEGERERKKEGVGALSRATAQDQDIETLKQAIESYNEAAEKAQWPKAQRLTAARRRALKARVSDAGGLEGWRAAMTKARDSPFLRGTSGRTEGHENWRPDLDFFLQAKSFTRLMEGSYDGTGRRATGRKRTAHDNFLDGVARFAAGDREDKPASRPMAGGAGTNGGGAERVARRDQDKGGKPETGEPRRAGDVARSLVAPLPAAKHEPGAD